MRILCVEPDAAVAQSIELMLKAEGFNVYTTDLGEEALDLGKLYDYDAITLELHLPDVSGATVIKRLREAKIATPIVVCSGLAGIEDKVKALGIGADAYITKPFHKDELVAHIHAVVRRSKGHPTSIVNTGNLSVNMSTKLVSVNGVHVHLTGKEYGVLELLSLRKGSTISKEMLLNHLYGGMDEPEIKIIDVFVCKIRKKLNTANKLLGIVDGQQIETVWGRGYVLRDAPVVASPSLAPEVRDMIDRGPWVTSNVPGQILSDRRSEQNEARSQLNSPSIVPAAGQR